MTDPWFLQKDVREEIEKPQRLHDGMTTVDYSRKDCLHYRSSRIYLARPTDVPYILADPPGHERIRHYSPQSRFCILRTEKPVAYLLPDFARRFSLCRTGSRYLTAESTEAASRRGDHVELRGSFLRDYVREHDLVIVIIVDSVRFSERDLSEFTLPARSESQSGEHYAYEICYGSAHGPHERVNSESRLLGKFVQPL